MNLLKNFWYILFAGKNPVRNAPANVQRDTTDMITPENGKTPRDSGQAHEFDYQSSKADFGV